MDLHIFSRQYKETYPLDGISISTTAIIFKRKTVFETVELIKTLCQTTDLKLFPKFRKFKVTTGMSSNMYVVGRQQLA